MALTKVSRGLLSTGIVDNSNATAITLNADESATFAGAISVTGTATMGGLTSTTNASMTQLTVNGTGAIESGINFASGGTTYGQIYFNNVSPYDMSVLQQYSTGSLIFGTNDTEVMRISGSNVGIGASSISSWTKLQVAGTAGAQTGAAQALYLTSPSTTANEGVGIRMSAASGSHEAVGIIGMVNNASGNAGSMTFHTYNGGANIPERIRIDSSGSTHFGRTSTGWFTQGISLVTGTTGYAEFIRTSTTDASSNIYMARANNGAMLNFFRNEGGSLTNVGTVTVTASATAYNTSSDYRLKENVVAITGATERLKQLNPSRFNFIADADTTVDGFLAHEVQDVVPEAITGTKDAMRDEEYEVTPAVLDDDGNVTTEAVMGTRSVPDYQGIDQSKLVPLLVATIQELEARLTALENN